MTKTAEFVMRLRPNQGWWLTLYLNGEHDGTLNNFPYSSSVEAAEAAKRFAAVYNGNGYETSIRKGETIQ